MRRLLVLLAALGVVAGCSTSIAGTPSPETGATAAPPEGNSLGLPPRPRELQLDGLDPCSPLTPPRLAKLGLDTTVPSTPLISPPDGRICAAGGFDTKYREVSIAFVTHPGIDYITTLPVAASGRFEPVQVVGFPGVIEPQEEKTLCVVDVDVAAGQFADITYEDADVPPTLSRAEICQGAVSVAAEVMHFLLEK
jgi:hypothetical protein